MFTDIDAFLETRRCFGLTLSPDGTMLVTTVQQFVAEATPHTSIWEIDLTPERGTARRLTWSEEGESAPSFTPTGQLIFRSSRPGAELGDGPACGSHALWMLPRSMGESRPVLRLPRDFLGYKAASSTGAILFAAPATVRPGDETAADPHTTATQANVRLHTSLPVRSWNQTLGPGVPHISIVNPLDDATGYTAPQMLTAPRTGVIVDWASSPAGDFIATVVQGAAPGHPAAIRNRIELVDAANDCTTRVVDESGFDHESPVFSADGRWVFWVRERHQAPGRGPSHTICGMEIGEDRIHYLAGDNEWFIREIAPASTGDVVYVVVDEDGHAPIYQLPIAGGAAVRLTSTGAYSDVTPSADPTVLYAICSRIDHPPTPVQIDPLNPPQEPVLLQGITPTDPLPGSLIEYRTSAADGTSLRYVLVLPEHATLGAESSVPLLLWIHGGPLASWNAWSWRWNPWLAAARGYAVLLPDPRLSTGYGQSFIDAATSAWGDLPYTDLMTVVDDVLRRHLFLDPARTAAMGASFGGYMCNWIAGHTNRFRAIVTHSGQWNLESFAGASDLPFIWAREWGSIIDNRTRYEFHSPHRYINRVATPMLVSHGDKDFRVPIDESLRLWYDLQTFGVPSEFLHFPDEGHWIEKSHHVKIWHETVFTFLDKYVLSKQG
jgi:dipeptidyl aminopeptidase/acylaminoacyl peptidase